MFPHHHRTPGASPCCLSSPPPPLKQVVLLPYLTTGRLPAQLRVGKQGPSHPKHTTSSFQPVLMGTWEAGGAGILAAASQLLPRFPHL